MTVSESQLVIGAGLAPAIGQIGAWLWGRRNVKARLLTDFRRAENAATEPRRRV